VRRAYDARAARVHAGRTAQADSTRERHARTARAPMHMAAAHSCRTRLRSAACVAPRCRQLGYTFLPCVLANLARAPVLLDGSERALPGDVWSDDIDALVVPAGACGGPAVLSLLATRRALVVAVAENTCALDVSPEALRTQGIIVVRSYTEALGLLAAHKAGVNVACLTPDVASIRELGVEAPAHADAMSAKAPTEVPKEAPLVQVHHV
jgi:hypothetical protein